MALVLSKYIFRGLYKLHGLFVATVVVVAAAAVRAFPTFKSQPEKAMLSASKSV